MEGKEDLVTVAEADSHLYLCDCEDYAKHIGVDFHRLGCGYRRWYRALEAAREQPKERKE